MQQDQLEKGSAYEMKNESKLTIKGWVYGFANVHTRGLSSDEADEPGPFLSFRTVMFIYVDTVQCKDTHRLDWGHRNGLENWG
jgi:hypothetical protein